MRRLGLISETEQLTGKGPAAFERLARSCSPGSPEHIGILSICLTLAKRATSACVAPSHNGELSEALALLQGSFREAGTPSPRQSKRLSDARVRCFSAAPIVEAGTVSAVQKASGQLKLSGAQSTELDPHAEHVVDRYVRLSAHYACASVCHSLDAWTHPEAGLEVLGDSSAALCYLTTGLGAGRQAALRAAASDQARWESTRFPSAGLNRAALSVQIFHEYLGGRFRLQMDLEQQRQSRFINWSLSGRAL